MKNLKPDHMESLSKKDRPKCRGDAECYSDYRQRLSGIVERTISAATDENKYAYIDYEPIPSVEAVIEILGKMREILFPGYFSREKVDPVNLRYNLGRTATALYDLLADQISHAISYECFRYDKVCTDCRERGFETALAFFESIPSLKDRLATDIEATYQGDPAAKSHDEIIFSYPGISAITIFRIAHRLYSLGVPLIPRMMTEYSHRQTGIDIHPGARIGRSFVIDHGTGVVIGETAVIGERVRIYQGVTIGALSVPGDRCEGMRGQKRHPTIGDNVVIYSGATILGGETEIGSGCVIGGNVWITESVPPDTTVVMEKPRLVYKKNAFNG